MKISECKTENKLLSLFPIGFLEKYFLQNYQEEISS